MNFLLSLVALLLLVLSICSLWPNTVAIKNMGHNGIAVCMGLVNILIHAMFIALAFAPWIR